MLAKDPRARVNAVISKLLKTPPENITSHKKITELFSGMDEILAGELILLLENEFGVTIPDEAVMKFVLVGNIYEYFENNRALIGLAMDDKSRVNAVISDVMDIPSSEITAEKKLEADLGMNEMDIELILATLEAQFEIEIVASTEFETVQSF